MLQTIQDQKLSIFNGLNVEPSDSRYTWIAMKRIFKFPKWIDN